MRNNISRLLKRINWWLVLWVLIFSPLLVATGIDLFLGTRFTSQVALTTVLICAPIQLIVGSWSLIEKYLKGKELKRKYQSGEIEFLSEKERDFLRGKN